MHSAHLAFVITALLPAACLQDSTDLSDTSDDATTTTGDTSPGTPGLSTASWRSMRGFTRPREGPGRSATGR